MKTPEQIAVKPDPDLSFENLVGFGPETFVGALLRVIAERGNASPVFNPLLLHSPSGYGKTHLLSAVANAAQGVRRQLIRGDMLLAGWYGVGERGGPLKLSWWRDNLDLLLLDDIDACAGHHRLQRALAKELGRLIRADRGVLMTASCPPREIRRLIPQLQVHLKNSITIGLGARSAAERRELLERWRPGLPPGVVDVLVHEAGADLRLIKRVAEQLWSLSRFDGPASLTAVRARRLLALHDDRLGRPGRNREMDVASTIEMPPDQSLELAFGPLPTKKAPRPAATARASGHWSTEELADGVWAEMLAKLFAPPKGARRRPTDPSSRPWSTQDLPGASDAGRTEPPSPVERRQPADQNDRARRSAVNHTGGDSSNGD